MTEACVLTKNNHPVSIFSEIHSSKEKHFTSINDVTFSAMERGAALFGKATFAMDRGYDDNKMFLKLDELEQDSTSSGEHEKCPPCCFTDEASSVADHDREIFKALCLMSFHRK